MQTIAVYLDRSAVDRLLALAGIVPEPARGGNSFTLPGRTPRSKGGTFGTDYGWEIDEATTRAIEIITSEVKA